MTTKLIEKREELRAKQAALAAIFEAAGPELDLGKVEQLKAQNGTTAKAAEVKRLNDELTALGLEVDGLVAVERAAADVKAAGERMSQPVDGMTHPQGGPGQPMVKSWGQMFVESAAFKEFNGGKSPVATIPNVDVKTLMTTSAGWAPQSIRLPGYVPHAERIPTVTDIVPMNTTSQAAIVYMEETTFTNNAAERTEGANNAGEAALALTERTVHRAADRRVDPGD